MPEEKSFGMEFEPIPRRQLPLFFIIDCSGSMEGAKIGSVNTTMRELMPELKDLGEADADVKVAVLTFASDCKWMTPTPRQPADIVWENLVADGVTMFGDACKELDRKMSRKEFLSSPGSIFTPVVILLSDGDPTDNYKSGLEALWKNNWFKNSMRFALPIGNDVNTDILAEFTGNKEAVLKPVTRAAELRRMLKMVSITSTSFASKSSVSPDEEGSTLTKYETLTEAVKEAQDNPNLFIDDGLGTDTIDYGDDGGDW